MLQRGYLRLTLFFCGVWSITLLYGEMLAFWIPLSTCSWPVLTNSSSNSHSVITLMDRTSLKLSPGSFALEAAQIYADIYMRRSFETSILPFKPDVVLFLGDQFDGGPYLSEEEWQDSLVRFKHIFQTNIQRRDSYIPAYFLSGNHDIGYSSFHSQYPNVIRRYEKEFGQRNFCLSIGKVEFVAIDAQTLDGPISGNQTSLSWNFIKNISSGNNFFLSLFNSFHAYSVFCGFPFPDSSLYPRVLLTHIPLYRSDDIPCGLYRSSPVINQVSELP